MRHAPMQVCVTFGLAFLGSQFFFANPLHLLGAAIPPQKAPVIAGKKNSATPDVDGVSGGWPLQGKSEEC